MKIKKIITGPGKYVRNDGVVEELEHYGSHYDYIGKHLCYFANGTIYQDDYILQNPKYLSDHYSIKRRLHHDLEYWLEE